METPTVIKGEKAWNGDDNDDDSNDIVLVSSIMLTW
jgi:hypothetical protein